MGYALLFYFAMLTFPPYQCAPGLSPSVSFFMRKRILLYFIFCISMVSGSFLSFSPVLKRIQTPEILDTSSEYKRALNLHDYTYGINSDPLAIFAMTFSALIHDGKRMVAREALLLGYVHNRSQLNTHASSCCASNFFVSVDHKGVSNSRLGEENPEMATKYSNKSIAEQHSLDLAWDLLMQDRFSKLRACIFASNEELLRFRQLIVNVVLATDIFDKELNDLRKSRWEQAFMGDQGDRGGVRAAISHKSDLKATIVVSTALVAVVYLFGLHFSK